MKPLSDLLQEYLEAERQMNEPRFWMAPAAYGNYVRERYDAARTALNAWRPPEDASVSKAWEASLQ
jgi:hypothetical protein